jgi:hypothetical protein
MHLETKATPLDNRLINISLITDITKKERQLHGQDIMLNLNSVLTEMLTTLRTLANAMVLSGSVEDLTNKETELLAGKNSECGVLYQRQTKLCT